MVSNITEKIVRIDPNAMWMCHTIYKHMAKGEIIIFSLFDIIVLHICIVTPIVSTQIYAKY